MQLFKVEEGLEQLILNLVMEVIRKDHETQTKVDNMILESRYQEKFEDFHDIRKQIAK